MIQFNILKKVIKNNFLWFLSIAIFFILIVIRYKANMPLEDRDYKLIKDVFATPGFSCSAIALYKSILFIYFTYVFYVEDIKKSFDITILRTRMGKWYFTKIIILILSIIIFETLYFLASYVLFANDLSFTLDFDFYIKPIIYDLLLISLTTFLVNMNLFRFNILFVMLLLLPYLFININIIVYIFLFLILVVLGSFVIIKTNAIKIINDRLQN